MYDLHTHSVLSDGVLLPMELACRYESKGYKVIALTDHVDFSNVDFIVPNIKKVCRKINKSSMNIKVIPGVEITYVPIEDISKIVDYVRNEGIKLVVGHGETVVEPVPKRTDKAFIEANVDILAHPGFISEGLVKDSIKKGVFLEITARKGHSLTNGYVAELSKKNDANLIINTDSHVPGDILSIDELKQVGLGSGLSVKEVNNIFKVEKEFVEKII